MADPAQHQPDSDASHHAHSLDRYVLPRSHWGFADYFWFILKNFIGWLFMLIAGPVGVVLPGPGGIPLFLIGFALITFPGKRNFTARILRGRPVRPENRAYRIGLVILAILIPGGLISFAFGKWWPFFHDSTSLSLLLAVAYLCGVALIWIFGLRGVHIINLALSIIARIRRKVRPWMRRHGLDLLPPRRRQRLRHPLTPSEPDREILEIDQRHADRLRRYLIYVKPWVIRFLRVVVIAAVFAWMLKPVYRQWPDVRERVLAVNWVHFVSAALMFAAFLFVFRVLVWRRIMIGFGHTLPIPAAARIWSFSELARYLPGVIWQVVGRVYLARPYGISGSVASASQILELTIFMFSNILVAVTCLAAAGLRRIPPDHRHWLLIAVLFIPFLLTLLHPRVFYTLLNRLMARFKKPPIAQALKKRQITGLVLWTILGLLWQSLAIWLLTSSVLQLPIGKWYVLAGSYCLAWTVGFSVGFLSPGGMGIRELVFIATMQFVLPPQFVAMHFGNPDLLRAFLGFLGVLLRLWAITGELTMAAATYLADYRGATNAPNAPGRVPLGANVSQAE
jgi:hypothetical protein